MTLMIICAIRSKGNADLKRDVHNCPSKVLMRRPTANESTGAYDSLPESMLGHLRGENGA